MGKKEEQDGDWKEGGKRVGAGQYDGYYVTLSRYVLGGF